MERSLRMTGRRLALSSAEAPAGYPCKNSNHSMNRSARIKDYYKFSTAKDPLFNSTRICKVEDHWQEHRCDCVRADRNLGMLGQNWVVSCSSCSEGKSPMVRFPDPQTILKQWEEWHVIVSCDQLGETLRAAPSQLYWVSAECSELCGVFYVN